MAKRTKEALVTDQPARKVIFSGLIISFLLGFFIRGLTKPELLQTELKNAVSNMHSSTQVNWGGVSLSLKNGWLPRFSVLIQDVKIMSNEGCWGMPLLYAREVELPVSFVSFIEHGQPLKKIYIRDAFLELKSNFVCQKKVESSQTPVSSSASTAIRLKPVKENGQPPPLVLTDFIFENLKVRQSDWAFPDWNFTNLEMNVLENHPWYAEVSSDFSIPDMEGVDTGAHLSAVYKEFPEQVLEVKVRGHWREGTFQLDGNWEGQQKGWGVQTRFNHIPFQFLKSVANRTKTPWNWPDKPMWFSFSTQTIVPFTEWKASQHFVHQLSIEGDLGELSIPDLEIKSWAPFKVQPFAFSVQQADLSAAFEKDIKKTTGLSSLGKLSGQGQWSSEKDVIFTGQLEQIQIPIFYHDQKFVQPIKSVDLQAELKAGQWKMVCEKWDIEHGEAKGSLKLDANQDLTTGFLQVNLDSLRPDPEVLKFVDIITPDWKVSGHLTTHWKKSDIQDFNAQLKSDLLESRVIQMENPILNVKHSNSGWDLRLQSGAFQIRELSFAAVDEDSTANLSFPYESKNMTAQMFIDASSISKWSLNSANTRSSGTIDANGVLKGTLSLGSKAQGQTFEMLGTRRSPQLSIQ
jgi:hypothetical protein